MSAVELGREHKEIDLNSASILDITNLVEQYLTPDLKRVFYSIYDLSNDHAPLSYDSHQAEEYVQQRFKSPLPINERSSQEVIDRVLGLATLFSPIRSKRPI